MNTYLKKFLINLYLYRLKIVKLKSYVILCLKYTYFFTVTYFFFQEKCRWKNEWNICDHINHRGHIHHLFRDIIKLCDNSCNDTELNPLKRVGHRVNYKETEYNPSVSIHFTRAPRIVKGINRNAGSIFGLFLFSIYFIRDKGQVARFLGSGRCRHDEFVLL